MNITLSTEYLGQLFKAVTSWLDVRRETLNNLNIFPVPDGDTGSNMHNTVLSACNAFENGNAGTLEEAFEGIIEKSLWGARGNSGVILSNFIKGFFSALKDKGTGEFSAEDFSSALASGRDLAYSSTPDPVEGTILTVIRASADKAAELAGAGADGATFLDSLAEHTREAVEQTKDQLEVLKSVGVVDSGGCGYYYLIEALQRFKDGLPLNKSGSESGYVPDAGMGISGHWEDAPEAKYCLEITLKAVENKDEIIESLQEFGSSEVAISTDRLLKIHIHTDEPESVISRAREFTEVLDVYKENMVRQQYLMLASRREALDGYPAVAAVAAGEGMKELFLELGASVVIDGGQTMNPSVKEIAQGIEKAGKENVILLINNRDAFLSSQEAVKLTDRKVGIIQTASMMDGIASLMSFAPGVAFKENVLHMEKGLSVLKNGYITRAVMDTPTVKKGEYFSGREKNVIVAGELAPVAEKTLMDMIDDDTTLLSIYTGEGVDEGEIDVLRKVKDENFPELELEIFEGGQPNFLFLFSLE